MIQNSVRTILFYLILAAEFHSLFTHGQSPKNRNQEDELLSPDSCSSPTIENGNFIILDPHLGNRISRPGESIPNYVSVRLSCNQNYALFPPNKKTILCEDGSWPDPIPTCKLTCPPLTSPTLNIECTLYNKTVDCSKPVLEGTIAKSKCKEYYISLHTYLTPIIRCKGGYWDKSLIQCVPDCGEGIAKGVANVVNGIGAMQGEFPWHVAIYHFENNKFAYKCGGSIIGSSLVISAAHCFTDLYGYKFPPDEYYIGAGKYYSAYNSEEDKLAQIHQVKEYHIPPYYSGAQANLQADLAVIVLKNQFQLSNTIRPVCIDLNKEFERDQLLAETIGSVVGWGYEDPDIDIISKSLKKLTAPFIEVSRCLKVVPEDFKRWVTPDKFCAGFTNGSSVCQGDSGGGMVFPWTINNKRKYYLRGIVSVGPMQESNSLCDSHQYGIYTQITYYSDFIQDIITNYTDVTTTKSCFSDSYESCRIPKIENGSFLFLDKNIGEGYSVPNYAYIQIYCNKNFTLFPNNRYLNCVNSTWHIPIPQCKQTCPPLMSPLARNIICTIDDKTVKCTDPVVDGAVAQITCNDGAELFTKCTAGSWNKRDPFRKCKQDLLPCNNENPVNCTNLTTEKTNTVQPPLSSGCPLLQIENGKYRVLGLDFNLHLGYIPNYSIIEITCNDNYLLYPNTSIISCFNGGVWSEKIPDCKQTCRPLISANVEVTCIVNGMTVDCRKPMVEGTIAISKCKKDYTMLNPTALSTLRCFEGSWDWPLMRCVPECGNSIPINRSMTTVERSEFPWHVGIYKFEDNEYKYICGGTIITLSVVISVAHCIYVDPDDKSVKIDYHIGAGKYYSAYNATEDKFAQIRKVNKYYVPISYTGFVSNFAADLAILLVEKPFQLTDVVQPVCVDWNRVFERQQLRPNSIGTVVGWGYAQPDIPVVSKVLKKIKAPFQNFETCFNDFPKDFGKFVTPDKFCAGFTNGSNNVCLGDTGGGLVFPWTVNNHVKYYLRGVLSVGPISINRSCDFHQRSVYTQVTHYSDFILDIIANNTNM